MSILNGRTTRLVGWLKDKLDGYLDPDRDRGERDPPTVSLRFKVTTTEERVYFVYARDEQEARSRLPATLHVSARVEPAGHVEDGALHLPDEEVRAVMASTQDDRVAPMK